RSLRRAEENREAAASANAVLAERLASLAEAMRGQQALLARMAEQSIDLRSAIEHLAERAAGGGGREDMTTHQRNIETLLARPVQETARGRTALADELRGEFRLLARTIASMRAGHPASDG